MNEFKVGDRVKRVGRTFRGATVSGVYTVSTMDYNFLILKEFPETLFNHKCFELVSSQPLENI